MRLYLYTKKFYTYKNKEESGTLILPSVSELDEMEDWRLSVVEVSKYQCDRLIRMLTKGGMGDDNIYPLDKSRTVKELISYIKSWE